MRMDDTVARNVLVAAGAPGSGQTVIVNINVGHEVRFDLDSIYQGVSRQEPIAVFLGPRLRLVVRQVPAVQNRHFWPILLQRFLKPPLGTPLPDFDDFGGHKADVVEDRPLGPKPNKPNMLQKDPIVWRCVFSYVVRQVNPGIVLGSVLVEIMVSPNAVDSE